MSLARFRAFFVVVPVLASSIVPTAIFGMLLAQWGSNVVWGSYFGLGWCLAAFWSGGIVHDSFAAIVGFCWGWFALVPLYVLAGWLWRHTGERGRGIALRALWGSVLAMLPAGAMMRLDQARVHLPDYSMHLAISH